MTMRNQISGAVTFDVSSLADAIAERLKQPSTGLTALSREETADVLSAALDQSFGMQSHGDAVDLTVGLIRAGYVLARIPAPAPAEQPADWFKRETD